MTQLYTSRDLLNGYRAGDPNSYVDTWDFRQYMRFVAAGGPPPKENAEALRQAQHDAEIGYALSQYLAGAPRLVGIMGGHGLNRKHPAFELIARISRVLTQKGFQIVTGGGPGAMEAGHFGAYFASSSEQACVRALTALQAKDKLPDLSKILNRKGEIDPTQTAAIQQGYEWLTAALTAQTFADAQPGVSLAVPTWLYGSEPTTPFATVYAKYYQNSIREETLVTEGQAGVLFAQGGGGTLREIFQTMERNYYVPDAAHFTPMIFVDPDHYWERDATFDAQGNVVQPGIKVDEIINKVIRRAIPAAEVPACQARVCFTDDVGQIVQVLGNHAPVAQEKLRRMLAGVSATLISPQWLRV